MQVIGHATGLSNNVEYPQSWTTLIKDWTHYLTHYLWKMTYGKFEIGKNTDAIYEKGTLSSWSFRLQAARLKTNTLVTFPYCSLP